MVQEKCYSRFDLFVLQLQQNVASSFSLEETRGGNIVQEKVKKVYYKGSFVNDRIHLLAKLLWYRVGRKKAT
jgi:hypothetical protein